jgi:hypothetical protein
MAYAEKTTVAFEKSVNQIIGALRRAGADQIAQFEGKDRFSVQFTLSDRMVRFTVPFPSFDDMPRRNGRNQALTQAQRNDRLKQARNQRGRALLLTIKAKLESIESGIETFEEAFLAHVVMSDGQTLYDKVREPIAVEYQTGKPSMLMIGHERD